MNTYTLTDINIICDNYIKISYDYYRKYDYYKDQTIIDYKNHNIKKYDNKEIIDCYNILEDDLKNYLYDKVIIYAIKYGDLELIKLIYKPKYKWNIDHIETLIKNIINYTYYDIFKFMIDNGLILDENIFDIIINKFNINIDYKSDYNYDIINKVSIFIKSDYKHYILQNIITICLDYIFNSLNDNFILDDIYIRNKYKQLFKYRSSNYNDDYFDNYRYNKIAINDKHIIMKHIIDNKYFIDNELMQFIHDYIEDSINYYNNAFDREGEELILMFYDKDDSIFISFKNFILNYYRKFYSNLLYTFNLNYRLYFSIMYKSVDNIFYKDLFDYIIIDNILDKKLFMMLFDDDFLLKFRKYIIEYDLYIFDYILDYYNSYVNNYKIDMNKVHLILSIIIDYIDNNLNILFDDKYEKIYKIDYFDRVNYHIIKKNYYKNNENLIKILKDVIENKSHRLYYKFLENI